MGLTDRFLAYAAAFEESFADDDWSRIEPYFTEGAVYETKADPPFGGVQTGRVAVLAQLKQALDGFDRLFSTRTLELLEGPTGTNGEVWFRWAAVYTLADAPDLRIEGEERVTYDGDRISRLEDTIPADSVARATAYMGEHAAKLGG